MTTRTGDILWRVAPIVALLGTIGCDRATKHIAEATLAGMPSRSYLADTIRLGYVENPGGFLSLGATLSPEARTAIFTVATGVMLVVMLFLAVQRRAERWIAFGLMLFVAGGVSNWIDRLIRGSVVDFLNVGIGPLRTGIFNVADVAIMIGALIFGLSELRSGGGETPAPATDSPEAESSQAQPIAEPEPEPSDR